MSALGCWLPFVRKRVLVDMETESCSSPRKVAGSSAPGQPVARKILDFLEAISQTQNGSILRGKKIFGSMVDVGCGDGSSTLLFKDHFKKVIGIDRSVEQITKAEDLIAAQPPIGKSSISFHVGSGEHMPFPDASQDLVCFSRSFHWMELMSDALREARRVLKPTGCIAMYCTSFPKIQHQTSYEDLAVNGGKLASENNKKANQMLDNFFRNACEMHPRCALAVDDRYRRVYETIIVDNRPQNGSKFIIIDDKDLAIHKRFVSLAEFSDSLKAYAGYKCAMLALERLGLNQNPLEDLISDLKYLWGVENFENDEIFLNVTWDVSLILSTRPAKIR